VANYYLSHKEFLCIHEFSSENLATAIDYAINYIKSELLDKSGEIEDYQEVDIRQDNTFRNYITIGVDYKGNIKAFVKEMFWYEKEITCPMFLKIERNQAIKA